jgi:hypothetical protein
VVDIVHPRLTSSVVETLVQVIHSETSWPASMLRTNLLVQMLAKRAQRVLKKTEGESNRISGLAAGSMVADGMVGDPSSSNFDGTGERDCCLVVVVGAGVTLGSMGARWGIGSKGNLYCIVG